MNAADSELKGRLLDLLDIVGRNAYKVPPAQQDLTQEEALVMALYAGCRQLFEAVFVLLRGELPQEAQIVLRTLVMDAVQLAYFERHRDRLPELALRYMYGSINQEIGLAQQAKALGLPHGRRLEAREEELQALRETAVERGVRLRALPKIGDMASDLKRLSLNWMVSLMSHSVHTTRIALGARVREFEPMKLEVPGEVDVREMLPIGHSASASSVMAAVCTASLLAWDTAQTLEASWELLKTDFEALFVDAGLGPLRPESS